MENEFQSSILVWWTNGNLNHNIKKRTNGNLYWMLFILLFIHFLGKKLPFNEFMSKNIASFQKCANIYISNDEFFSNLK